MVMQEIENKKTTVWKLNHTLTTRDFWFLTIPAGFLLMFSVGTMTQTNAILGQMGAGLDKFGGFSGVMAMIMIFGLIGSYLLGLLDQKMGTQRAMIIACAVMLIAGILGAASSPEKPGLLVAALIFLALFMGASSNFTVSLAAQYWRREDFSTVFAAVNPIANILSSLGPMLIAVIMIAKGYNMIFVTVAIIGVVSIIMCCAFSAKRVKAKDDKYREAVGKPLDDALVGRK
jgi:MFS family permease